LGDLAGLPGSRLDQEQELLDRGFLLCIRRPEWWTGPCGAQEAENAPDLATNGGKPGSTRPEGGLRGGRPSQTAAQPVRKTDLAVAHPRGATAAVSYLSDLLFRPFRHFNPAAVVRCPRRVREANKSVSPLW